ncbi:Zinc finger bed domain-containing protein 4 [Plakobranchus ocellatus]|uniref:Zinc finger bed domain-containing protein 4 n=1 Tax=Plakobranchus ocellatus TaxID=259542 RepID=A0AAV4AYX7_9GAST|nr:Zinc finger bed domain-containing protein 4 [Plakobranchus ocellatus]
MKHTSAFEAAERAEETEQAEEKYIRKYIEKTSATEFTCSICLTVFRNVTKNNLSFLKEHLKIEHPHLSHIPAQKTVSQQNNSLNLTSFMETRRADDNLDSDEEYVPRKLPNKALQSMKKLTSPVWHFMVRTGIEETSCRLCNKKLVFCHRSTSNMLRHIRQCHLKELKAFENEEADSMVDPNPVNVSLPNKTDVHNHKDNAPIAPVLAIESKKQTSMDDVKQLDELICNMIVSNLCPSSLFDDSNFKRLVKILNPKYFVPNKESIDNALSTLHKRQQRLLEVEVNETPGLAISVNIWKYQGREIYMTVTAHFVSTTWEPRSAVLKTVLLDPLFDLTACIAEQLVQILNDWNINVEEKVQCIVSNAEEYISTAVATLNKPCFQCIGETLNHLVRRTLESSNDIMYVAQRVRDVARYFFYTTEASDQLLSFQNQNGKAPLKLMQDTASNWMSTFKMLKSYLELHDSLGVALQFVNRQDMLLSLAEQELLTQCVQVLEPFYLAAEDMIADGYTALSKSIPVFEILNQMTSNIFKVCPTMNASVFAMAKELNQQVSQKLNSIKDRANLVPCTATLLDPRFKHIIQKDPDIHSCAADNVQQILEALDDHENDKETSGKDSAQAEKSTSSMLWSIFDETIKKTADKNVPNDLQRYTEERLLTRHENPFLWWKDREPLYLKLCMIAKKYLCIPATAVPANQIFSEEEKIRISRRNFLDESHLDSILFLSSFKAVP